MKHMGRAAVWILLVVCLLLPPAGSRAAAVPADGTLAGVRVLYTLKIPALDGAVYTLWASGIAFAVGPAEGPVTHYVTDAGLLDYDTALSAASKELRALFEKEGFQGIVDTDEKLAAALEKESVEILLYADGKPRAASPVPGGRGWALLQLAQSADSVNVKPLPLAEEITDGSVSYWSVGDASYGLTKTPETFSYAFQQLGGSVQSISGSEVYLDNPYTSQSLGSPVIDASGKACAIVVGGEDGGFIAIGLTELAKTLADSGLLPAPVQAQITPAAANDTSSAEKERFQTIIIAATAVAGVLLLALILLLVLQSRRKRMIREDEPIPPPIPNNAALRSASAPRSVPQSPPPRPASPVSSSVATTAPRPQSAAAPRPVSNPPSVMLAVLDGRLQGFTLHISEQVFIGRDPKQCKMVFGPTQTEISRRHCAITYNPANGNVLLEDLNSANGTYTPDGRRFAPGKKYLLQSGDRFCIGVRENMIEVRK